jgi:hypothetical protein
MTEYEKIHEIDENLETNEHLAKIVESMKQNGWRGRPLLVDGYTLFTGCHRYTASKIAEIEPELHQMEITLDWGDDDDWMLGDLVDANDDHSKYQSIKQLFEAGYVDEKSYELIKYEYDNTGC